MASTDVAVRERTLFEELEQATNLPAGSISVVGLRLIDPDMAYGDWESLGRTLGTVRRWTSWAIGDWYNFGEALYGHEAAQASDPTHADRIDILTRATGLKPDTLSNYASVCGRIAMGRRRPELDFSVHEPVASLEPEEQTRWLQEAVDNGWTRDQLRTAIRDEKNPPAVADNGQVVYDDDRMTRSERLIEAARLVYHQARVVAHEARVPIELYHQLGAALGEED